MCAMLLRLEANAILNDWAPSQLGGVLLSMEIPPNVVKVLVELGVSGMMIAKGRLDPNIAAVSLFVNFLNTEQYQLKACFAFIGRIYAYNTHFGQWAGECICQLSRVVDIRMCVHNWRIFTRIYLIDHESDMCIYLPCGNCSEFVSARL